MSQSKWCEVRKEAVGDGAGQRRLKDDWLRSVLVPIRASFWRRNVSFSPSFFWVVLCLVWGMK